VKRFILITLTSVLVFAASSAIADDPAGQLWIDYHEYFYLSRDWEFYGDTGYRMPLGGFDWATVYGRPSIRLHAPRKPAELRAGLGVFYTNNRDGSNQWEVRPWLGFLLKWPRLGPLTVSNYFRLEERFFYTVDESDWSHETRLRYRIGTKIPLSKTSKEQYFFIPMSAELFFDVDEDVAGVFSDRFRLDTGVGYIFSYVWTAEFHAILQESRSSTDEVFDATDLIFRFQIKRLWSAHDYMSQD
jgi:hypothetical protein